MKFVEVKEVPNMLRGRRYRLTNYWEEFMKMNVKVVKVDLSEHEYSSIKVARTTFIASIKRGGYPIDVALRKNEVYLVRRDM
jgi:hypothetical protein